uniref:Reverse transcriptase zinc-binding domain-containing protein n=1 Tax=Triticum urartu TaxID=4572 RepID=A0A8R7TWE4_TRIUA
MTHFLQRKRGGRVSYAAIKLDMSKAYDRVEWKFLQGIMLKLGFNRSWVQLVMNCVTTVKYQIKVNGDVTEIIIPKRGLRQDDSLLLLEVNADSSRELNQILNSYEACSGQAINKEKSAILFSKNTKLEDKEELMNQLNIAIEGFSGIYLGLPCYIGRSKTKAFEYIKEKVWKRLQGGKEKLLSKAGKEVLIKAVAQAIHVYAMACFDLTKSLCEDVSSMIARFWWSQLDKENKIHWVGWDKLTKPKKDGGLGFRDLYSFNLAMLARQAWRMLQNPCSLCAQVMAAKYYPNQNLLQARPRDGISYSWRSILKGVQVLQSGIIWRVGDGRNINIWADPWLPRGVSRRVTSQQGSHVITKVSDLIDPTSSTWDLQLIDQTFNKEDVEVIVQIPIREGAKDTPAWHFDKKGIFSVKSAYQVVLENQAKNSAHGGASSSSKNDQHRITFWKKLWTFPLPNKILHFLWRLSHYSLLLRMKLQNRGMEVDTRCPVCHRMDEDGGHCFLKCKFVKAVWRTTLLEESHMQLLNCPNAISMVEDILHMEEEKCLKVCILLWLWWSERNRANQGERIRTEEEIIYSVQLHLLEYKKYIKRQEQNVQAVNQVWCPPPDDFLKINTDGAFRLSTKSGGWGFTIKNNHGIALVVRSREFGKCCRTTTS